MPVVHSLDGVFTLYQDRSGSRQQQGSRKPKIPHEQALSEDGHPPGTNLALLALQQAYEKGSVHKSRKPAVLAQDIMTSPVITLAPETLIPTAWSIMKTKGIRHIPIVSETGPMIGIVSDRDLLRLSHSPEGHQQPLPHQVRQLMTTDLLTAIPTTPIQEIAGVMLHEHIGALPILDGDHLPVGILTTSDILRALINRAPLELWT